jgi:asparagine synthase (glutamine-hydrolysing)
MRSWPCPLWGEGLFYFDRGAFLHAQVILPSEPLLRKFWGAKAKNRFRPDQLEGLSPPMHEELCGPGSRRRTDCLVGACQGRDFLSSLDHFYNHQRVNNFHGNGLKLYGQSGEVVAPMNDRRWVAVSKSMPRSQKLGSRWNRSAIKKLCPELLSFPEQSTGRPMAVTPPWLYGKKKRRRGLPYADYTNWFRSPSSRPLATRD